MKKKFSQVAIAGLVLLATGVCRGQTGHVLDAVGPVNQSMGGAGTALPLDAIGSLHWNPASIAGLPCSEIGFGFMAFAPQVALGSRVEANGFGPGLPAQSLAGRTTSDGDISPIPSLAFVHRNEDSPWSFGLGGFAIGGFGVDFPVDPNNPILTPQPPQGGLGFGGIYSQFQMMQFCPTVACQLTPEWSAGFAPTFNWASLALDPFSANAPNPDGTYGSGAKGDASWGLGFQTGVYYQSPCRTWNFGASYKSPQWFQEFQINGVDHQGAPRRYLMDLDYPAIASLGLAYLGFQRVKVATDIRYIDYANTDGFQPAQFDSTATVTGFGWSSIWVFATGVELAVTERLQWRIGYTFNENPIDSPTMFFTSPAPAIVQHHLSTGFTCRLLGEWSCSLAYHHGFRNRVAGSWWHPTLGKMPGTEVTASLATHGLVGGISRRF